MQRLPNGALGSILPVRQVWGRTTTNHNGGAMKCRIYYPGFVVRTDNWPEIIRARKAGRKVETITHEHAPDSQLEHSENNSENNERVLLE